ncbi:oligopeptide transporter 1 [Trichomonascus vanleenenianus]|uniref:OPT family oligopeptide transporter n=1 Tax=Trichomonascus vanleenenianus TaxID=2268995 RepID=UPI003EC9DA0F
MASNASSDAISPSEDNKLNPKLDEKVFVPGEEIETVQVKEELTNEVIVSKVIDSSDNPDLNPWTFRSVFLGIGLSIFGAVLAEIYYFKPQTILVNGIFLLLIAYVLGEAMSLIPRHTSVPGLTWLNPALKFLNPHPFNIKEHVVILTMSSTASTAALATEVLAVQKLWYTNSAPVGKAIGIFTIFTSQVLGYGIIGVLRKTLVYPTKMFYPNILPQVSTLQALHNDKGNNKRRLKLFYLCFGCMFLWEIVPEWMFELLIGFSIPCLAASNSSVVSNIFGGTNGNEGLGLLSFCFDWNYIAGTGNPMTIPIVATMNNLVGYFLCIAVFLGVYYGNVWEAQKFPFLSQSLYTAESEKGNYVLFNQTQILDSNNNLDVRALEEVGVPYMTPTYTVYLIATNLSIAATFTHMYLYHWDIMKQALGFLDPRTWKNALPVIKSVNWKFWQKGEFDGRLNRDGSIPELSDDPHFRAMLHYKEVPHWWYICALILSFAVALVCLYVGKSGLPWWALIVAMILAALFTTVLGGLVGMFGFGGTQMQTVIQMIGSYIHPGNPVANMYFTLYGYNSVQQAFNMLQDLKQAQYIKLAPRSLFVAQFCGTIIGAIFNYVMMESIVTNQKEILLSIEGTAIWSGQNIQQYNTQGISWGALAKYMYSVGCRYEWVPLALLVGFACPIPFYFAHRFWPKAGFQNINVPILVWYIGWLCVGVNSSITSYFVVAFVSQWYLRRYYPDWFKKYNYIVAAGLTGGAQVMVFVLSFAVAGASGAAHNFPSWWGNNLGGNFDHCHYND